MKIAQVVNSILGEIRKDDKIILLEGMSGSGKTSVSEELGKKLKAIKFSMGEIFRYLTHRVLEDPEVDFNSVISKLSYRATKQTSNLFKGKINISENLANKLRSDQLEKKLPEVAAQTQYIVLNFIQKEIEKLRLRSDKRILIEGRSFTLDFLPGDLRIKLVADPSIRAERRWAQGYKEVVLNPVKSKP